MATNIAETSITIDDVVFVIDCGRVKEMRYDGARRMASLETVWVSRASARQRRGRAGRVKPGYCFHMFSSKQEALLEDFTQAEIMRVRIYTACPSRSDVLPAAAHSLNESLVFRIQAPLPHSLSSEQRHHLSERRTWGCGGSQTDPTAPR